MTTGRAVEVVAEAPSVEGALRQAVEMGVRAGSLAPAAEEREGGSGAPVLVRIERGYVQTIQLTARPWKAAIALSLTIMVTGISACSWAVVRDPRALTDPPLMAMIGAGLFAIGLAGLIVARVGAWWRHG